MTAKRPAFLAGLERKLRPTTLMSESHFQALRRALAAYAETARKNPKLARHPLMAEGQPLDAFLLHVSPLYRRSRELYLRIPGARLEPRLVTSPRSLSSAILLEPRIQYSPGEDELLWAATDPAQKTDEAHLMKLITYSVSLFHEQNHRILWTILPKPARVDPDTLRRYLNFVESVVIALDMAMGDSFGPKLASLGYLSGVLYDPGANVPLRGRDYLNYLHAALRTTYLALEYYNEDNIRDSIPKLHREIPGKWAAHACDRALRLDLQFVANTNPAWQEKNRAAIRKALRPARGERTLQVAEDAADFREPYVWAEKVLQAFRVPRVLRAGNR